MPYRARKVLCIALIAVDSGGLTERTMMLVAPSAAMSRSAACLLPSPIDTITITAATPKMMPRLVRMLRNLCNRRLCKPRRIISRRKVIGNLRLGIYDLRLTITSTSQ